MQSTCILIKYKYWNYIIKIHFEISNVVRSRSTQRIIVQTGTDAKKLTIKHDFIQITLRTNILIYLFTYVVQPPHHQSSFIIYVSYNMLYCSSIYVQSVQISWARRRRVYVMCINYIIFDCVMILIYFIHLIYIINFYYSI